MDELESVKRRVKKLLALSKSPNENEAASALRKANDLYELGQQCSWRNPKELKAQQKQIAEFVEKQVAIETSKKKFEKATPEVHP